MIIIKNLIKFAGQLIKLMIPEKHTPYKPNQEESSIIAFTKNNVIDYAVGDVAKSAGLSSTYDQFMDQAKVQTLYSWYRGGTLIGAFILALCVIQHISKFLQEKTVRGIEGRIFKKFVADYLNGQYNASELYGLRNSLIKEYSTKVPVGGGKYYLLAQYGGHLQQTKQIVKLSLPDLLKDIHRGVDKFFQEVLEGKLPRYVTKNIISHYNRNRKFEG